jgi:periplasmic divalent cation tolerance protein
MDNPQDICWVYMTAGSPEEAGRLGEMLIERRLAACVNVLGVVSSLYRWEGAVKMDDEIAFIAKTTVCCLDELTTAIREAHSYDEPCVVALPVIGGSAPFLQWVRDEVTEDG